MANMIQTLLTSVVSSTSPIRFTNTNANLKVNGILIDSSFIVPSDVKSEEKISWDFLKNAFLTVGLRLGNGNGSAVQLISSCTLYQLLGLSDFEAGVSMNGTSFTPGEEVRISGAIDVGYFAMGARDALEISVVWSEKPAYLNTSSVKTDIPVTFTISSVFEKEMASVLKTYQSAKPTGADQPYTNVLAIYYDGNEKVVTDAVITDETGNTQSVDIESAIALSNAEGNFEFFTRFGRLYNEPFGISQNLSFKVPNADSGAELLIVGYSFNPELLVSNATETNADKKALIEKIKNSDPSKYSYLEALGIA